MDSNPTTDNFFRNAGYAVIAICAAVFIIRIAWYAIPLFQALSR